MRKEQYYDSRQWFDARLWASGDMASDDNRVPWELECHRLITGVSDLDNVVKLRATTRSDVLRWVRKYNRMFRAYMEFCPHGNLDKLIAHYRASKSRVPEPMIWNVAEALARCGAAMHEIGPGDSGRADRQETVHR